MLHHGCSSCNGIQKLAVYRVTTGSEGCTAEGYERSPVVYGVQRVPCQNHSQQEASNTSQFADTMCTYSSRRGFIRKGGLHMLMQKLQLEIPSIVSWRPPPAQHLWVVPKSYLANAKQCQTMPNNAKPGLGRPRLPSQASRKHEMQHCREAGKRRTVYSVYMRVMA